MNNQREGKRVQTHAQDSREIAHRRRLLLASIFLCVGVLVALSLGAMAQRVEPVVESPVEPPVGTPTPEIRSTPTPAPLPTPIPALDFSSSVPESAEVEGEWFADAVFLGDSRSDGLRLYSGIRGADFLAYKSLMVFQVTGTGGVDAKAIPMNGTGEKKTVLEWLEEKDYAKIYVMFGINELGYRDHQAFEDAFALLIDEVRACQPQAVLYIQSLIPVEPEKAQKVNPAPWLSNENVAEYNAILRQVCEEKQAVYVDVQSVMADENGTLPAEGTTDGIHFTRTWYQKWYAYLKNHTVDPAAYEAGQSALE